MSASNRYRLSKDLTRHTRAVSPGGAQTMSKRPERFPEGAFPAYLRMGHGAKVWDVDGNRYVDWICGLGAVPLGYNHDGVRLALKSALYDGLLSSSLPTPWEERVASRLVQIIPCAGENGQVRFVKTGSEACAGAVRIARRYTKRDLVILIGYHGWHDWAQTGPGIPSNPHVIRLPYNDANQIADVMRMGEVAAVMLEPTLLEPPKGNYLSDVVTLCTLHGALSIFDEMVMGFRWARAGGQEFFQVTPDLAVFGKGLANGMPLACIIGPEDKMAYADVISGTFGGEVLSLAAADAVLDAYDEPDELGIPLPISKQWRHGNWFLKLCEELEIPVRGYPVHPHIPFVSRVMALFLQETAKEGLLLHPAGFNVSAALTPEDLQITERALRKAKVALENNVPLEGVLPVESILRRNE